MDITKDNFLANLGSILFLTARSDYIAIDLELSGISTKGLHHGSFKSVDEVYESARQAASTFQAVQLGLTFVCFVEDRTQKDASGVYKTFTVSIPISPMFGTNDSVSEKMAELTGRQFSLSCASLLMLEKNGFDLKSTLDNGVPYLSREEQQQVLRGIFQEKDHEHIDPATIGDWAVKFYNDLREELCEWLFHAEDMGGKKYKVFDPQGTGTLRKTTVKLVRQLIREEFPQCRCSRDRTDLAMTIQVIVSLAKEEEREGPIRRETIKRVWRQIGVTWVVEAILGPEGRAIASSTEQTQLPPSYPDEELLEVFSLGRGKESWGELLGNANRNKPVLLGHNVLHDLCFLHMLVVGQLPESMEEFRHCIHKLFPRLIDTKVMTAQMTDGDAVDETLEELFKLFKLQDSPHGRSIPGWGYNVYNRSFRYNQQVAHEAGFDSYMTATVFLKAAFRQLELQDKEYNSHIQKLHNDWDYERPEQWLRDPAREDPALLTRAAQLHRKLPGFHHGFFEPVANKLRMSVVGLLDLATPTSELEAMPLTDFKDWVCADLFDSSDDVMARLNNAMNKLQLELEKRLGSGADKDADDVVDLCERLGYLHGNMEARTARNSRNGE